MRHLGWSLEEVERFHVDVKRDVGIGMFILIMLYGLNPE
jgi:hypothetical protein